MREITAKPGFSHPHAVRDHGMKAVNARNPARLAPPVGCRVRGDAAGPKDDVVGYLGVGVGIGIFIRRGFGDDWLGSMEQSRLSIAATTILLCLAFAPLVTAEPAPGLRVGDYWLYDVIKPGVPTKGQINISVTSSDGSGYQLKVLRVPSSGPKEFDWTLSPDLSVVEEKWAGGVKKYDPALRELPFPISVGAVADQKVSVSVTLGSGNATVTEMEHKTSVTRKETVEVPAGKFEAYVVERADVGSVSKYTIWYAPAAGAVVRREYWEGSVPRETWELSRFSYGAAPASPAELASLGPVGAGIAVGTMVLFAMALLFFRMNGRLGGPRVSRSGNMTKIAPASAADDRSTSVSPIVDKPGARPTDDTKENTAAKNAGSAATKSPKRVTPDRRRTPEELEAEYEEQVATIRARLKSEIASEPKVKQAKLLLAKAELAARQGRHDEAVDLVQTANERLAPD